MWSRCDFYVCVLSLRFYQVRAGLKVSPRVPHRLIVTTQDNTGKRWSHIYIIIITHTGFDIGFTTLCSFSVSLHLSSQFSTLVLGNRNLFLHFFWMNLQHVWRDEDFRFYRPELIFTHRLWNKKDLWAHTYHRYKRLLPHQHVFVDALCASVAFYGLFS